MKRSEIEFVIDEQDRERRKTRSMEREALKAIRAERNFATVMTGVRRCGKSTLLAQYLAASGERAVALSFDDLGLVGFALEDFRLLDAIITERKATLVGLDEIQLIDGWERYVSSLVKKRVKVLVTGSNAKMLSRELGTMLTGRHLDMELFPFSYPEFLRFTKRKPGTKSLDDYVSLGGFPAFLSLRVASVLRELLDDILYRDVIVRYGLGSTAPVRQLAAYLLTHVGAVISPSRLKDAIHVQQAGTVLDYFDHLKECFLVHRLERHSESPKARMLAPKKIYVCDTGLCSVVEKGRNLNLGHKLENVIYWHLYRKGGDLTYYRDKASENECDFIREDDDGSIEAIQVAWELNDDNEAREIAGLLGAMRRFGLKKAVIVTRNQRDYVNDSGLQIGILPAYEYLMPDFDNGYGERRSSR